MNWAVYKPKIIKVREKNFFTIHLAPTSDMQFLGMNLWILCTGLSTAGIDFSVFFCIGPSTGLVLILSFGLSTEVVNWAVYKPKNKKVRAQTKTDFVYWALYCWY